MNAPAAPVVPIQQEYADRTIHYYDIHFSFSDDTPAQQETYFVGLFHLAVNLSQQLNPNRHWLSAGRRYFVKDVHFEPVSKQIHGKLCSIRTDLFPELGNFSDDTAREIEAEEDEGILETSHFVIAYRDRVKHLALEYNDVGPKAADLRFYLEHIGRQAGLLAVVVNRIISADTLRQIERRMGRISEMDVRVFRENVQQVATMNQGLATTLAAANELFDSEMITLKPKLDYRSKTATASAREVVDSIVRAFTRNPTKMDAFKVFRVKAEDRDKNGNLDEFDLLEDKIKSRIRVQKRPRSRVLISTDIFQKMVAELERKRLI
ncbi:hypothetical protein GKZ68_10525 [Hymenobacter sp. BRD128]|uniref:hypothetical protein n=1 Tax=Hymenobacter sp. BRD128 TaxID=2675878 RepID=UPI001567AB2E|nr:hypothetical protein [Hymenobacter sp. BRD128]QKG57024.1 hypothetical protein GKZ68_10525 [Hymenobacter sp. BRD128]